MDISNINLDDFLFPTDSLAKIQPYIGPLHKYSCEYDNRTYAERLKSFLTRMQSKDLPKYFNMTSKCLECIKATYEQLECLKTLPSCLSEQLDEFSTISGRFNVEMGRWCWPSDELHVLAAMLRSFREKLKPIFELPSFIGIINSSGELEYFVKNYHHTGYYMSADNIQYKFDTLCSVAVEAYYGFT
jgi:hypothetical protein